MTDSCLAASPVTSLLAEMAGLLGFYYGETLCQVKSQSFKNLGALYSRLPRLLKL